MKTILDAINIVENLEDEQKATITMPDRQLIARAYIPGDKHLVLNVLTDVAENSGFSTPVNSIVVEDIDYDIVEQEKWRNDPRNMTLASMGFLKRK